METQWYRIASVVPVPVDRQSCKVDDRDDHQRAAVHDRAAREIVIGCIALDGLAAFNTARRMKEISHPHGVGCLNGKELKLLSGSC